MSCNRCCYLYALQLLNIQYFQNRILHNKRAEAATACSMCFQVWCQTGVGVRATVNFPAHGGPALPPPCCSGICRQRRLVSSCRHRHAFHRSVAAHATSCASAISSDCSAVRPGSGARPPPTARMLAVAEINKRGGILGREIELSIYDAGGPIDEVVQPRRAGGRLSTRSISSWARISARCASRCARSPRNRIPYIYTPGLRGRRTHAGRDGDRRDAALAEPARRSTGWRTSRRRRAGI